MTKLFIGITLLLLVASCAIYEVVDYLKERWRKPEAMNKPFDFRKER